jgi:SAM-dependent methyltransferase
MIHSFGREEAADLAATAAFLEMADGLGLTAILDGRASFTIDEAADQADLPIVGAARFIDALVAAQLVEHDESDGTRFRACADMAEMRYEAGYLTWSLYANQPFVENPAAFLRDRSAAMDKFRREGRRVAVSSRWIGSQGFYPQAFAAIVSLNPRRVVDLGAGTAGLLIDVLAALPESTGLALDISADACAEAQRAARRAGVADRLEVVTRPIESLVDDSGPVAGADVVHAGFVMHDIISRSDVFQAVLRRCRAAMSSNGRVLVTDGVGFVADSRERRFSALFAFLHANFMDVDLPPVERWVDAFRRAGFGTVTHSPHRFPNGRLFVAAD